MSPSAITPATFNVLHDPLVNDRTLPAFMVSTQRGFLPRLNPVVELPHEFAPLEAILSNMPQQLADGQPGLLATGKLGSTIETSLPNLIQHVEKYKEDQPILNALYRDYSFLASAYLLEPCHWEWKRTGGAEYGLGRQTLPRNIAEPIARAAELTGFQPFMEYAGSYALYNYRLLDPAEGMDYDNLALIRAFENGLDNKSSEAGFILVHVDMVQHSGGLVSGSCKAIEALNPDKFTSEQVRRQHFDGAMTEAIEAMEKINLVMEKMWKKSKPGGYTSFRTFIFGITSQSMFPNGVIYEGVAEEPMFFRGESGANDSMVPLIDNLCQIPMPETPLTEILKDFRKYRPGNHKDFLEWVQIAANGPSGHQGVMDYALDEKHSASLYLLLLDQVREFRFRHWCFTRDYILRRTKHPRATGGSPIVQWLPNQLVAVFDLMQSVMDKLPTLKTDNKAYDNVMKQKMEQVYAIVAKQRQTLDSEVRRFSNVDERGKGDD